MQNYSDNSPVLRLLELGDPDEVTDWSIYRELRITSEHFDELSQMAIDVDLLDSEVDTHWAGPIHAWRMLGELGMPEAIGPLIQGLQKMSEELLDWAGDELSTIFARIGPSGIPALTGLIANTKASNYSRWNAARCISAICEEHPESRADGVAVLTQQLEKFATNDPDLNAMLLINLVIDLRAVESIGVIEKAFQAGRVNEDFMGDWDEVQVELGLKDRSEVPEKPRRNMMFDPWEYEKPKAIGFSGHSGGKVPKTKAKAKRQAQSSSRKKNRKK